jgi:rSAM/selenodomain-associated transferase 1
VVVFAKAPVPGQVKTRLIPALGAAGAAALALRLLRHALHEAVRARMPSARDGGPGLVELCVAPHRRHPAFDAIAAAHPPLQWAEQGDGDLGARMARALGRHLAAGRAALLIGTDAPALDAPMLRAAAAALARHDAVFVPALDGGYALVGLSRPAPTLFEGIAWSTGTVMAETRARAAAAGLRWQELPAVADIDRPEDLAQLPAALHPGPDTDAAGR